MLTIAIIVVLTHFSITVVVSTVIIVNMFSIHKTIVCRYVLLFPY